MYSFNSFFVIQQIVRLSTLKKLGNNDHRKWWSQYLSKIGRGSRGQEDREKRLRGERENWFAPTTLVKYLYGNICDRKKSAL